MSLILYSGKDCCLCDQAEALISQTTPQLMQNLIKVDVRSTTELYHEYGARIPVLKKQDSQQELPWPFDQTQLVEFLS